MLALYSANFHFIIFILTYTMVMRYGCTRWLSPMVSDRHCKRCGHVWRPRRDEPPVQCPDCRSPYWDKEKVNGIKRGDAGVGRGSVEQRAGDDATMPVLPSVTSGGVETGSQAGQPVAGGRTRMSPPIAGSSPASPTKTCPSCGALNGMHQRGCKG